VQESFDVVVVGGGLAGLTLARALSEKGHPTAVLEARRGIAPLKRGMSLAPNGLHVLDKLKLLGDVLEIGCKLRFVKYLKASGDLLVAYDYHNLSFDQNYLLSFLPHELEAVLQKRALQSQVKIFAGAKFDGLLRDGRQITGIRATIEGAPSSLRARIVVGADGGKSVVRQTAGIKATSKPYESSYAVTVTNTSSHGPAEEATHHIGKGQMLGDFPLPHGHYLFFYIPAGSFEKLKARGLEHFKADIATLAPGLSESLEGTRSWDDFLYMIPQEVRVDSWVKDNVALIGDAAHSMEPSIGQGGSLALSDVAALLDVLEVCFAKSDFSAKALKPYELARRAQTEALQRMAELTATVMNTDNRLIEWFRDRSLRGMRDNPKTMMLAMETASGLRENIGLGSKLRLAGFL
jgi:2-polyprenyl-6-methoxyphenol hydroxylase-like FAD-dependent oxidoreductase